jgi:hypothetical protein
MRNPTKVALKYLAETMVENDSYINLRGTGDFINEAVKLHRKTGSFVTVDTIRRHQKELEQMCLELLKIKQPIVVDDREDWQKLYDHQGFELPDDDAIELLPDDVILRKAEEIKSMMNEKSKVFKNYNMFIQSDDILWKYGNLALRVVGEPGLGYYNNANIWTPEKAHAKYMLTQKPNSFTEDDIELLTKIASGKV